MADMKPLIEIMARLRDPDGGCPWDLEQDFSTISPHTIEEAYEVDEAIESGDLDSLRDELGDLLFQVVFQARIAEELGAFDFEGVVEAISSKLIRRHPHVFSDAATPESVGDHEGAWESIKAKERAESNSSNGNGPDAFVGIPRSLPALARSAKLAGRLERPEIQSVIPTPAQRPPEAEAVIERLSSALDQAESALGAQPRAENEREADLRVVGEGLRSWVWLARALGVDPEQALRTVDDETIAGTTANWHQATKSQDR